MQVRGTTTSAAPQITHLLTTTKCTDYPKFAKDGHEKQCIPDAVASTVFDAFCWFSRPCCRFATIRRIAFALFDTVGFRARFLKFSEQIHSVEHLGRIGGLGEQPAD
jgi:hypothetical protein